MLFRHNNEKKISLDAKEEKIESYIGCDFIYTKRCLKLKSLLQLPIQSNAAYIYSEEKEDAPKLWYINKLNNIFLELALNKKKLSEFQGFLHRIQYRLEESIFLDSHHLKNIRGITGHTHVYLKYFNIFENDIIVQIFSNGKIIFLKEKNTIFSYDIPIQRKEYLEKISVKQVGKKYFLSYKLEKTHISCAWITLPNTLAVLPEINFAPDGIVPLSDKEYISLGKNWYLFQLENYTLTLKKVIYKPEEDEEEWFLKDAIKIPNTALLVVKVFKQYHGSLIGLLDLEKSSLSIMEIVKPTINEFGYTREFLHIHSLLLFNERRFITLYQKKGECFFTPGVKSISIVPPYKKKGIAIGGLDFSAPFKLINITPQCEELKKIILLKNQFIAVISASKYYTPSSTMHVELFNTLNLENPKVGEFFIKSSNHIRASATGDKIIICDSRGRMTSYQITFLKKIAVVKDTLETISQVPSDVANLILQYSMFCGKRDKTFTEINEIPEPDRNCCLVM